MNKVAIRQAGMDSEKEVGELNKKATRQEKKIVKKGVLEKKK